MKIHSLLPATEERRAGYRMPVPSDQQSVLLRDRDRLVPGICVDQSATGFGVYCRDPFPWFVGQKLLMNKDDSWYEVMVARVEQGGEGQFVGLHRLSDCDIRREPTGLAMLLHVLRTVIAVRCMNRLQIMGIMWPLCVAFLFFVVVLTIAFQVNQLPEDSPLLLRRPRSAGAVASHRQTARSSGREPASANRSVPAGPFSSRSGRGSTESPAPSPAAAVSQLSWLDVERSLGLSPVQSERLLKLLLGETFSDQTGPLDSTKIQVHNTKELATSLESLPPEKLDFLTEQQRDRVRTMARSWNQQ